MQKQHVFVVTGRQIVEGIPRGAIKTLVVCAVGEVGVRRVIAEQVPGLAITTITGLVALEARVRKIRGALSGVEPDWGVVVDPGLLDGPAPAVAA